MNEDLKKAGCYTINFGEMLTDLASTSTFEDGKVKISYANVLQLIQLLHDNIAETLQECEQKELVITLPKGLIGATIKTLVTDVLKLKINLEDEETPAN